MLIYRQNVDISLTESQNAHLVRQVEFSGPVEVEDGVEGARVAVEEELVFHKGVITTPEVMEGREIVCRVISWWRQATCLFTRLESLAWS